MSALPARAVADIVLGPVCAKKTDIRIITIHIFYWAGCTRGLPFSTTKTAITLTGLLPAAPSLCIARSGSWKDSPTL
jgi:hypothetical protein